MKKDSITDILNYLDTYGTYKIDNDDFKKFYNVLIESYNLQSENKTYDSTIGKILEIQPLDNFIKTIATDKRYNNCTAKRFLLQLQDKQFNGLIKDFHMRLLSQLRVVEDLMKQYKIEVTDQILLELDKNLSEVEIANIVGSINKLNEKEELINDTKEIIKEEPSCVLVPEVNNNTKEIINDNNEIIKEEPSCVLVPEISNNTKEIVNDTKDIVNDNEELINKKLIKEELPCGLFPIGKNVPFSSVQLSVTKTNTKSFRNSKNRKTSTEYKILKESFVNNNELSKTDKKRIKNENINTNFNEVLKRSRRRK